MKVDEYSSPSEDLSIMSAEEDDEESQESDVVKSENSINNQQQIESESVKNIINSNENSVAEPGILVINLIKHLFPGQDVPHVLSQLQEVYQKQEPR